MVLKIFATFIASLCFALLFNAPKEELLYCGLSGAVSMFVIEITSPYLGLNFTMFLSTMATTIISRILAYNRKNPITIYLIAGIIPLVPGSGIYYTMYYLLMEENMTAFYYGMDTIKIAGIISLGIAFITALPHQLFRIKLFKERV